MKIVPFDAWHLAAITPQEAQHGEVEYGEAAEYGDAYAATVEGVPVAVGGLVDLGNGTAYAWALLSTEAGPHLLRITREIRFRLDQSPFARIEMAVDAKFLHGCRWAERLGFSFARSDFLADGRPAYIFERVKCHSQT